VRASTLLPVEMASSHDRFRASKMRPGSMPMARSLNKEVFLLACFTAWERSKQRFLNRGYVGVLGPS
jgi:hypothetical protein